MALYRNIAGLIKPGVPPVDIDTAQAAYNAEMQARYDWLLSHSLAEATAAGYYVMSNDGAIFQWSDAAHTTSTTYLPLYDIQRIENERGAAGTLLLHMQEPELAKDSAGYSGGSTGTWSGQQPDTIPIPAVQDLPPVIADPTTGTVYFDPSTNGTTTPITSTPLPVDVTTALKDNWLPLSLLGAVLVLGVAGDKMRRARLFALGGISGLFITMAKK